MAVVGVDAPPGKAENLRRNTGDLLNQGVLLGEVIQIVLHRAVYLPVVVGEAVDPDGVAGPQPLLRLLCVLAHHEKGGLYAVLLQNLQHLRGPGGGAVVKGEVAHLLLVHAVPLVGPGIEVGVQVLIGGTLRPLCPLLRRTWGRLLSVPDAAVRRRGALLHLVQLRLCLLQGAPQPHGQAGGNQNGQHK